MVILRLKRRRNNEDAIHRNMNFISDYGAAGTLATYARTVPLSDGSKEFARKRLSEMASEYDSRGDDPAFLARAAILHAAAEEYSAFESNVSALLKNKKTRQMAVSAMLLSWQYLSGTFGVSTRIGQIHDLDGAGLTAEAAIFAKYVLNSGHVENDSLLTSLRGFHHELEAKFAQAHPQVIAVGTSCDPQFWMMGVGPLDLSPKLNYGLLDSAYLNKVVQGPFQVRELTAYNGKDARHFLADQVRCLDWLRFLGDYTSVLNSIPPIHLSANLASQLVIDESKPRDYIIDPTLVPAQLAMIRIEALLMLGEFRKALGELDAMRARIEKSLRGGM